MAALMAAAAKESKSSIPMTPVIAIKVGASQPPWVIWVIRQRHAPLMTGMLSKTLMLKGILRSMQLHMGAASSNFIPSFIPSIGQRLASWFPGCRSHQPSWLGGLKPLRQSPTQAPVPQNWQLARQRCRHPSLPMGTWIDQ